MNIVLPIAIDLIVCDLSGKVSRTGYTFEGSLSKFKVKLISNTIQVILE